MLPNERNITGSSIEKEHLTSDLPTRSKHKTCPWSKKQLNVFFFPLLVAYDQASVKETVVSRWMCEVIENSKYDSFLLIGIPQRSSCGLNICSNVLTNRSVKFMNRSNGLANRSVDFINHSNVLANHSENFISRSNILANRSRNFINRSNG